MFSLTEPLPDRLLAAFADEFKARPAFISRAPGRVNIIGEHTDYNDGFVLPAAIDKAIFFAGRLRDDNRVNVLSLDYEGKASFMLDNLRDDSLPGWTRYPRGVLWVLREEGHTLRGMDVAIVGDVPRGGGFSSSAAVEVSMLELASALFGIPLTQAEKALLGQQVEHRFVGIRSGVMDQMISAVGQKDHAVLIDCRSLETTPVPLPQGVTIVTIDTGVRRELVGSEYGLRREQCEEAARILGVKALRDVTPEQLAANLDKLPEVAAKRATHVVNEDRRTLDTVAALERGDIEAVGRYVNASHASLRDLYEVSIRELDIIADLAQKQPGCYGARMMGGGFGGAVIALVRDDAVAGVLDAVVRGYREATGREASVYHAKAGPGSSAMPVT
ncbi:MAG: galactokinase [Anaerolineae bacterium]|nr:galactokinase [Anaerolineae bacterium]